MLSEMISFVFLFEIDLEVVESKLKFETLKGNVINFLRLKMVKSKMFFMSLYPKLKVNSKEKKRKQQIPIIINSILS